LGEVKRLRRVPWVWRERLGNWSRRVVQEQPHEICKLLPGLLPNGAFAVFPGAVIFWLSL
jgi:hypothetical protein